MAYIAYSVCNYNVSVLSMKITLPLRNYRIVFNISVFVPLPTFSKCWMMLWFPSKLIMKCLNSPHHHLSITGICYLPVCVCEKLKLTCMCGADWGVNVQTIVKCQWCLHTIRPRNILFLHFNWIVSIANKMFYHLYSYLNICFSKQVIFVIHYCILCHLLARFILIFVDVLI